MRSARTFVVGGLIAVGAWLLLYGALLLLYGQAASPPQVHNPKPIKRVGPMHALQAALRDTLGEARFGGIWFDEQQRLKVGVVAVHHRRAETIVKDLAAKHGQHVEAVPVSYSLAAIEACHHWVNSQVWDVNHGAPLPMGAGIGRHDPGLGVVMSVPDNATKVQRDFVAVARQRCGGMLKVVPGHVLVTPLASCNITACDPPLRQLTGRPSSRAPSAYCAWHEWMYAQAVKGPVRTI